MSRAKYLAIAALLPVLAAPVASQANSGAAMDACVQAFLTTDVAKDRNVVVQKDAQSLVGPISMSGLYKIEVVARGRQSGKQIGRVVCHANSSGQIVALNGRPVNGNSSLASLSR